MDGNKEGEGTGATNGTLTASAEVLQPTNNKENQPQTHRLHLPPFVSRILHPGESKQNEAPSNIGPTQVDKIYEPGSPEEKKNLGN